MLAVVERENWYYFEDHELPRTGRYAYHQPHFFLLGKNETTNDRNIALKFGDVEKTRDYAEILKFEFENEIMSEHFGNYWSLSIKIFSARLFPNPKNIEVNKK